MKAYKNAAKFASRGVHNGSKKPSVPLLFQIIPLSGSSIRLDWTIIGLLDGHSIERSTDGVNFTEINTVTGATNTYTDSSLTASIYYYRIRAYKGTRYSSYTDIAYNLYPLSDYGRQSVIIGSQKWTAKNLDDVLTAMGISIPEVTVNATWTASSSTPAWCYFNNNSAKNTTYGKLYNFAAIKKINDDLISAGSMWRVASKAQYDTLIAELGGTSVSGGKLKELGTANWAVPNTGADNSSGFTAVPCGYRMANGNFDLHQLYGLYGTITENGANVYDLNLLSTSAGASMGQDGKGCGLSLRLINILSLFILISSTVLTSTTIL